MKRSPVFAVCLILISFYGLWGLRWGLPSEDRAKMVLNSRQYRNPEFYAQIASARDDLYKKIGNNVMVYMAVLVRSGKPDTAPTMLNAYSSFLLKTHATDEANTLVTLSHIKPQKNEWFPHSFVYGGAYLLPLGAFLTFARALRLIKLVSSSLFYYMNPHEIANVYLAARTWSVCGLLAAACAIFCLSQQLFGTLTAQWAMLFFGLAPTCLAYTKYAKPHTWAAAFTLWAVHFAVRAQKEPAQRKCFVGACLFMGLALGTTISQTVFLMVIVWACWSKDWRTMLGRGVAAAGLIGGAYVASNFYLITHVRDYLDEQFFLRQAFMSRFNVLAIWQFFISVLRISMGWELWALSMIGWTWSLFQKKQAEWKSLTAFLCVSLGYMAFQGQGWFGFPGLSRLFLAMIGLFCIGASAFTFEIGSLGRAVRWLCLIALLTKGAVMGEHFRTDCVPDDNASKAALWVAANIPAKSAIGQPLNVPQTDCFPPIQFSRYRIVSFDDPEFLKTKGPIYAIISAQQVEESSAFLKRWGFTLIKEFNGSPLQKLGYEDPFTNANFPVEIYQRGAFEVGH